MLLFGAPSKRRVSRFAANLARQLEASRALWLVALVGLTLRLFVLLLTPDVYGDVQRFAQSAAIFARGGNIFVEQYYWNYTPAYGVLLVPLRLVPLPFNITLRLFLSGVCFVNACLAARLSRQPRRTFILYWLNPVFMLLDAWQGQFEQVALLAALLALCSRRPSRIWLGGLLALLIKHLTLPLTWCLYLYGARRWQRAVLWMVAALALFALSFAPYLPNGVYRIVTRVLLYHGVGPVYGLGSPVLFYAALVLLPLVARRFRLDVIDGLLFTALGQMVFIYGIAFNYFTPTLALAMIRPTTWGMLLTLVLSMGLAAPLVGLSDPSALYLAALWGLTALGLAGMIRRCLHRPY
jgi:hypothetical protein